MSYWGGHPVITRDEARRLLRKVAVTDPCTDCLHFVEVMGGVYEGFQCVRCGAKAMTSLSEGA